MFIMCKATMCDETLPTYGSCSSLPQFVRIVMVKRWKEQALWSQCLRNFQLPITTCFFSVIRFDFSIGFHFKNWTKLRLVKVYFCYITKWVRSMHPFLLVENAPPLFTNNWSTASWHVNISAIVELTCHMSDISVNCRLLVYSMEFCVD